MTKRQPSPEKLQRIHDAFLTDHADELDRKAAAVDGAECPVCGLTLKRLNPLEPWLRCDGGHTIRPWTDVETGAMDR